MTKKHFIALADAIREHNRRSRKGGLAKMKVTKAHIGSSVNFRGYDGKTYAATITDFRRRIATIRYTVTSPSFVPREATAYTHDLSRLEVA